MKHTKEPWIATKTNQSAYSLLRAGNSPIEGFSVQLKTEDAERAVACVNACAGLADPSEIPTLLELLEVVTRRLGEYMPVNNSNISLITNVNKTLAKARGNYETS